MHKKLLLNIPKKNILKLDRYSPKQKTIIIFCLTQWENETNSIPLQVKLLHTQYFAKHFKI